VVKHPRVNANSARDLSVWPILITACHSHTVTDTSSTEYLARIEIHTHFFRYRRIQHSHLSPLFRASQERVEPDAAIWMLMVQSGPGRVRLSIIVGLPIDCKRARCSQPRLLRHTIGTVEAQIQRQYEVDI
jgi:hypothetical protein